MCRNDNQYFLECTEGFLSTCCFAILLANMYTQCSINVHVDEILIGRKFVTISEFTFRDTGRDLGPAIIPY